MIYWKYIFEYMNKSLIIIGLVLVILGLVLLAIFPSSVYKSARNINLANYGDGDKITVYGTITDISYTKLFNVTQIILDGKLKVYAPGDVREWHIGDDVYMEIQKTASLNIGGHEIAYWTTTERDIHSVNEMKSYFYIISISGAIVAMIGLALKRMS